MELAPGVGSFTSLTVALLPAVLTQRAAPSPTAGWDVRPAGSICPYDSGPSQTHTGTMSSSCRLPPPTPQQVTLAGSQGTVSEGPGSHQGGGTENQGHL